MQHKTDVRDSLPTLKGRVSLSPSPMKVYQYLIILAIYLLITLVMFIPATLNINTLVPGYGGDVYLSLWGLALTNHVFASNNLNIYFTKMIFWPIGANLTYQTLEPLSALMASPLQHISLGAEYNAILFLGFALSGLTTFLLSDYLVKNKYAAFIAGLIYTFSAFHILHSYQLDFANIEWIPIFILFFFKLVKKEGIESLNIIIMSASFALCTLMGNVELSVMLMVFVVATCICMILLEGIKSNVLTKRFAVEMIAFCALVLVMGYWSFIPMITSVLQPGGVAELAAQSGTYYTASWSNNLLGFLVPIPTSDLYIGFGIPSSIYNMIYTLGAGERAAYIGLTAMLLAVYGVYKYGIKTLPYLVLGGVFAALSLGPYLQIGPYITAIPGLYQIYSAVPVFNLIREPARFDLVFYLFLGIVAAYGVKAMLDKKSAALSIAITASLSILILLENIAVPMNSAQLSSYYTTISTPVLYSSLSGSNFSILPLPSYSSYSMPSSSYYIGQSMLYSTISNIPIVGGWTSRQSVEDDNSLEELPLAIQAESPIKINSSYTNETMEQLHLYNTKYIVLSKLAYNQTELAKLNPYLNKVFGNPIYNDSNYSVFKV
jgi:hypothetical protein